MRHHRAHHDIIVMTVAVVNNKMLLKRRRQLRRSLFDATPLWASILLQSFAHAKTVQLSCHVQSSIAITSSQPGKEQK